MSKIAKSVAPPAAAALAAAALLAFSLTTAAAGPHHAAPAARAADPVVTALMTQALADSQCPASLLHLEITESSIMEHVDQALETLHRLAALGVHLTIDDFGTGYSSLSKLKQFPVRTLKIDRSFIHDIEVDASDDVLVDAILALAQKLGLRTVAEGVETRAQVAFLEKRGCDAYQGFLFSRPCDSSAFMRVVRERNGTGTAEPMRAAEALLG